MKSNIGPQTTGEMTDFLRITAKQYARSKKKDDKCRAQIFTNIADEMIRLECRISGLVRSYENASMRAVAVKRALSEVNKIAVDVLVETVF